jgi:3-methylfumaryl-CoA hydratase
VGDAITRLSTIEDVTTKQGRTGSLVFVKVRHEVRSNGAAEPAIVEHHDIVYREARQPGDVEPPPQAAEAGAPWQRDIVPDDVLLFRYSALTFNGHRIHYDRKYVTEVEGYPGLIVHGPLIATLLMDLLRTHLPDASVQSFRFKAVRPTFDLHPFRVNGAPQADGKTVRLWAQDHEGWLTMDAVATLR